MTRADEKLEKLMAELIAASRNIELAGYPTEHEAREVRLRAARAALRKYVNGPIENDDDYADAVLRCDEYKRRTKPHLRLPEFRRPQSGAREISVTAPNNHATRWT